MKKFTSGFAVVAFTAVLVSSAFASGGASGTGGVSAPGSSGAAGATTSPGSGSSGNTTNPGTTPTGDAKSKAEQKGAGTAGTPSDTGSSSPSSPSASPATTTASGDFTGRHTMEGEVLSVNPNRGHLKLKTAEGNMDLHFPASALANVKKGDRIAVELALKPAGSASIKSDKDAKGSASPKTEKK